MQRKRHHVALAGLNVAGISITLCKEALDIYIWTICYLSVLIGLSAYGIHRYFIVYLFLKNRKRETVPASRFEQLPKVTMQLPIFNEVYVVERLLKSVSEIDYPRELSPDPGSGRFHRRYPRA